jgi:hypothetical protein
MTCLATWILYNKKKLVAICNLKFLADYLQLKFFAQVCYYVGKEKALHYAD